MLSLLRSELERYTKPLCADELYAKKMENYLKVEQSFLARKEYCDGLPIKIHVEPSGICNLRCPVCPSGRRLINRKKLLPYKIFKQVFLSVSETLVNVIFSGWGEPLLNPETPDMVKLVSSNGVSSFMNTNGTLLEENTSKLLDANLSLIKISLDGATSKSVHLYNEKFTFDSVVRGVEHLCNLKIKGGYNNPIIIGQFVISEETVNEMEELEEWALNLGVDQVKFRRRHHTMPGQKNREELYNEHDFSRIFQNSHVSSSENLSWTHLNCSNPWDSFFLSSTGKIGLCSFDPYLQGVLSNAEEHDIPTIWNNEYLRTVRRWHSPEWQKDVGAPCKTCNRLPGQLIRKK